MTTGQRPEGSAKPRAKKAGQRRVVSESTASKSAKESDVSVTTTSPASTGTSAAGAAAGAPKDFGDFLGSILPGLAGAVAPDLGIDPRVAGQTVSQILSIFGIGGPGKAFTPTLQKQQAISQIQQVVTPHLSDPAFVTGLQHWMLAALEPVQAQQGGKAYQPSVDLTKNWFSDAINTIGNVASSIPWGQVAQVGMQILPMVLAAA